jgi:catechol 2,3-dioxygenase-like lactoylglutathione lyase family enzyme
VSGLPALDGQVTFLFTRDLEATAAFWEGTLGLPLVLDQGSCRIVRTGPGAYLGYCRRDAEPPREGVIVTLVSKDVEGWHAALVARGVKFEKPLARNEEYDITHCFLRDPNGYLVEIQRFDDPRWPRGGK